MKFNKKILTSLAISATSLLIVPMAFTIVSCSNNSSNTPSLKDQALTNIKNNILNKSAASWTLPSTVTNENLSNVLNLSDFSRTANNGFEINNLEIGREELEWDWDGILKIRFELTNGIQKSVETIELSGFLNETYKTANQNPLIREKLNMLNVEQLNGRLITNVTTSQNKPSFEDYVRKPINQIFSEFDNELFNRLKKMNSFKVSVMGLDEPGEPVVKNGITLPIIRKTLQIVVSDNGKLIKSSPFTLEIRGFSKTLRSDEVVKLINMGVMVNPNTIKNTFSSEVTDAIASATSQDKTTLFSQDLSNDSNLNLFDNYNDITIQYQKGSLKNPNNSEGSIEATFDVKMSNNTFQDVTQENSFSVPTKIYGFIIGNPDEFNAFTEMDFYISQKLMAVNLYGRNLSTDVSKYKIECLLNGNWWDDSSNWELQSNTSTNNAVVSNKLTFTRKTINPRIKGIRVSEISNPNNNLVRLVEKRNTIELVSNEQNAKTFNLDLHTAANVKNDKLIDEKWIIDNKNLLFMQNSIDLVTQPTDIEKLTLIVDGETNSLGTQLRTLTVSFEIIAGKYYDEYGLLATTNLPISFKINNFSYYTAFSVIKTQIDATTFMINSREKLSTKTKAQLFELATPEWLLENITKFFYGTRLIKSTSDFSVSRVVVENEENTKATLSFVIKKGKYYDQLGYRGQEDKQVTIEFINLFDFKVLTESLIKNDFTATELALNHTNTSGENIDLLSKEWLFAKKDKIWDPKATALIKSSYDIDNVTATVNDSDKTKLNVTVGIKAGKSYDQNGLPSASVVESSFTISGFKIFNELVLSKSEFSVYDFGLYAYKTGMENSGNITSQKLFNKRNVIWNRRATTLMTSADDIVIKEIKKTRNENTKLDVKIAVSAGKFYDSNGLISTIPKEFTINIGGFKDFVPFTLSDFQLDLTATSVGLSSSDKLADVVVDANKIALVTQKVQDILDSKINNLSKAAEYNKNSSIIVGKFDNLGDKLLISIKVDNIYGGNGLSSTTGPYDFHVTGFTS